MADLPKYDGREAAALAALVDVPRLIVYESTASTMDDAHGLAATGAPAGSVVLADRQSAGRGRNGRRWASDGGRGIWMTLIERPNDPRALEVLSIRVGLRAARALDRFAPAPIRLKWPNDLFIGDAKLAGILIEARWRASRIDWVAIGVGVNVRVPSGVADAAELRQGVDRVEVVTELVPAVRAAAHARGALTDAELREFGERDLAFGRLCVGPARGEVRGIAATGELLVNTVNGLEAFRDGSLTFAGATG